MAWAVSRLIVRILVDADAFADAEDFADADAFADVVKVVIAMEAIVVRCCTLFYLFKPFQFYYTTIKCCKCDFI